MAITVIISFFVVLFLTLVWATRTSGAAAVPSASGSSPSAAAAVRVSAPEHVLSNIRSAIIDRRAATWRWQDELAYPHTRTAYRERASRSVLYLRWIRGLWATRADHHWREYAEILRSPAAAICHVFGSYCSEAIAVARCESGHSMTPRARNGQYLGSFQMGDHARSLYGHGSTVLEQARAAYRYFVASGRDWSPWSCRP